ANNIVRRWTMDDGRWTMRPQASSIVHRPSSLALAPIPSASVAASPALGQCLAAEEAQQDVAWSRVVGVQLEAGALEVRHRVGLAVCGANFILGRGDRVAELGQAAVVLPVYLHLLAYAQAGLREERAAVAWPRPVLPQIGVLPGEVQVAVAIAGPRLD